MAAQGGSLPELDRRLSEEREKFGAALEALRRRVRRDLNPRQQLQQHPGALILAAAVAGLLAGRILGALLK